MASGSEKRVLPRQFIQPQENCTLLEYVLDAIWTVSDEIYVVFEAEPTLKLIESIAPFGVKIVVSKDASSRVAGMTAGFKASKSEHCFVAPDNVPFLKPNVIFALYEAARGYDAAIPKRADGNIDPVIGVYRRKSFLRVVSQSQSAAELGAILDNLYAIRFVHIEEELKPLDPELQSFFTVNTSEDLRRARRLASTKFK